MSTPVVRSVAKSLKETTTRLPYSFNPPPLTTGQRIQAWSVRIISLACGLGSGYSFGGLHPNKYIEDGWQYDLNKYHKYDDDQMKKNKKP